jgi:hypothetical protein
LPGTDEKSRRIEPPHHVESDVPSHSGVSDGRNLLLISE